MSKKASVVQALCPRHGDVIPSLLNSEEIDQLSSRLAEIPSSDTWYSDIYSKAIYGPMLFRDETFKIEQQIKHHFPGYMILADLYLEKTSADKGFPFHTDFDSNGFMEKPEQMISVWIPLTPVNQERGGHLSISVDDSTIRLGMIRTATQLYSLLCINDKTLPEHQPFTLSAAENELLESKKFTPDLSAGDALVFCNAFFHKSEDVMDHKRCAYVLRLVPEQCEFSRARLLALKSLGQNLTVVQELLDKLDSTGD
eukprot:m.50959 g.50959  ORF g.50959 m.50959 type:complete len:255 (+) comp18092_c0_seq1:13-777(+)